MKRFVLGQTVSFRDEKGKWYGTIIRLYKTRAQVLCPIRKFVFLPLASLSSVRREKKRT